MDKNIALLVGWRLSFNEMENCYYVASTHLAYLVFVAAKYENVYLICPVLKESNTQPLAIISLPNITIIPLPHYSSYIQSLKHYKYFRNAIISAPADLFYCRVPDPFSWMPKLLFGKKCILHFVGDTINATINNKKWNVFLKLFMLAGYLPEYCLTLWAGKKSKVCTNGFHIALKIRKYGIEAIPVISSILEIKDLDSNFPINNNKKLQLVYIGYLRYSKGIDTIYKIILLLIKSHIEFIFDIIGEGEMYDDFKYFITNNNLEKYVILRGHIDDRKVLNNILLRSDLFIFPSLSEGSPRVVLEAMSQGVPVISTPVGSLPDVFIDKVDIRFADFNKPEIFIEIIEEYLDNKDKFILLRNNAYNKIRSSYTKDIFMNKIFSYEK